MTSSNFSNSTETAKAGLNLTLDPVEKFIFSGLQKQVLKAFEAKSVWTTATDKTKALQQLFGSDNQEASDIKITYPYVFLILNTLTESPDRGNIRSTAHRGLPNVAPATDGKRTFRMQYIPVDFSVGFEFVTNNYRQVLEFANRWLFARRNGWLKFNISYGRVSFSIDVEGENSVPIPPREADLEGPSEYVITTNLTVSGYISNPTLIEQQVTTSVQFNYELSPENTTVWSFNSPADDYSPPDLNNTASTQR